MPYPNPYYYPYPNTYDRLRELENRYGQYNQNNPYAGNNPGYGGVNHPDIGNHTEPAFVAVSSAKEAWEYKSDKTWTGEKQWFINEKDGEIYCWWFDASKPATLREVFKKTAVDDSPMQTTEKPIASDRLSAIESSLAEIKELIQRVSANSTGGVEVPVKPKNVSRNSTGSNAASDAGGTGE